MTSDYEKELKLNKINHEKQIQAELKHQFRNKQIMNKIINDHENRMEIIYSNLVKVLHSLEKEMDGNIILTECYWILNDSINRLEAADYWMNDEFKKRF